MHPFHSRTGPRVLIAALAILTPLAATSCGGDDEAKDTTTTEAKAAKTLEVSDVWARTASAGGNGAVYMVIVGGSEADALVSASVGADVADRVELHETTAAGGSTTTMAGGSETTTTAMHGGETTTTAMHGGGSPTTAMGGGGSPTTAMGGGMMTMHKVDKIPVAADSTVELKPGGLHVMLFGLKKDLTVGEKLPVTLTFEKAGEKKVTAEVREP